MNLPTSFLGKINKVFSKNSVTYCACVGAGVMFASAAVRTQYSY